MPFCWCPDTGVHVLVIALSMYTGSSRVNKSILVARKHQCHHTRHISFSFAIWIVCWVVKYQLLRASKKVLSMQFSVLWKPGLILHYLLWKPACDHVSHSSCGRCHPKCNIFSTDPNEVENISLMALSALSVPMQLTKSIRECIPLRITTIFVSSSGWLNQQQSYRWLGHKWAPIYLGSRRGWPQNTL